MLLPSVDFGRLVFAAVEEIEPSSLQEAWFACNEVFFIVNKI